jgi:thiazole synthase ThiGH ThiG subunit
MATPAEHACSDTDTFRDGDREFTSRLLVGTGKYRDFD